METRLAAKLGMCITIRGFPFNYSTLLQYFCCVLFIEKSAKVVDSSSKSTAKKKASSAKTVQVAKQGRQTLYRQGV